MGTLIDIRGARTWYAAHGSGEPLVYLLGGLRLDFLTADPVPTIAPIRRAQATRGPA